ncbi:MAG: hypothetical protein J6V25_13075 [Oscillospiraceae bacterium]|nr:hypothetical protein [Oscillospiraceae bacterium]
MWEFEIRLQSVQDVQEFVALATNQSFPVLVGNDGYKVSGKCFMEMFCLDYSRPLIATAECSEADFHRLRHAAQRFLVR